MSLPILGLALAIRFIHLDQLTHATTRFLPSPAELAFLAAFRLDTVDPTTLRTAGVLSGALTAVLVQRLGMALVGPATGLYAGLWVALWWPSVALSAHLVPAAMLTLVVALALLGTVAALEARRPFAAFAAGLGAGAALVLDAGYLVLLPAGWLAFALQRKWNRSTKLIAAVLLLAGVGTAMAGLNGVLGTGGRPPAPGLVERIVTPPPDAAVRSPEAMAEDPWGFVVALGGRALRLAAWEEPVGRVDSAGERVRSWALRLPFPTWELAFPLALVGIVLTLRARPARPGARYLALLAPVLLVVALRAPITAESRLPLVPALVPLALMGLTGIWERVRKSRATPRAGRRATRKAR